MQQNKVTHKKKRKSHLKLGKETFGDMPIDECFKKAFEPYFCPDKSEEYYTKKLGEKD